VKVLGTAVVEGVSGLTIVGEGLRDIRDGGFDHADHDALAIG